MIYLITILVSVCILINSCKQDKLSLGWIKVGPEIYDSHPYNLHFFNQDSGIIFGQISTNQSYTISTTDGGENWDYKEYPVNYPEESGIWEFSVVNKSLIYGYSRNMLLVSHDYCQTWSVVDSLLPERPQTLKMIDAKIGIIGGIGHIYKTIDGGKTWNMVYSNQWGGLVNRLFSFNETFYATLIISTAYGGLILRSDDYGNNWHEVFITYKDLQQVGFLDKSNGMALLYGNETMTTCDGGQSWQTTKNNLFIIEQYGYIQLIDKQDAYLISQQFIMHTEDGGISWNFSLTVDGCAFQSIQMLSKNCGYAVDVIKGSIYKFYK